MFNFLDIQRGRQLLEAEVLVINQILKRRAYRYVAAGKEEWLYPERRRRVTWREPGEEALLMPDPRPLSPNSEVILGYRGGATTAMDAYGRLPGQPDYAKEMASDEDWTPLLRWQAEFEARFGPEYRGAPHA
jgi:hypothetical protein